MNETLNDGFFTWVKLSKHCKDTGDTPNSVHARRRKKQWKDGVHCIVGPDGNLYVNPLEYKKWVESKGFCVAGHP
jgi:hypothetical protein